MNDVKTEIKEIIMPLLQQNNTRVILYIDDLDKCPPDKIVDVLEAIQLLLSDSVSPFIVFLSADSTIIIKAIESYYKVKYDGFTDINGYEYINKMLAISFSIPNSNTIIRFNVLKNVAVNEENKVLKKNCQNNILDYIKNKDSQKSKLFKDSNNIIKLFYELYIGSYYKEDDIEIYKEINKYISDKELSQELKSIIINDDIESNLLLRNKGDNLREFADEHIKKIEDTISENISNYDNLEELYYSLDKLEIQLRKKDIDDFKNRISNIKNNINNHFDKEKETIINKLFKGYSNEETKVFCDLSYYLGNNMNVRRSKRVINMYNISRYILPSYLLELRPYIIQIIIMAEFWNYRVALLALVLDIKHKNDVIKHQKNFLNSIENISLKEFYKSEVTTYINKYNKLIPNSIKRTDYNHSDFESILEYNEIQVIHFYKLYNFIFNIDQCLKAELDTLL